MDGGGPVAPPSPAGARTVDDLIGRLRELWAWRGLSYREVHRRVVRSRKTRGIPEEPAYNTVYRSLQPGRSRLDVELVVDIARVLLDSDDQAVQWRQAYQAIIGKASGAGGVAAFDALPPDLPEFTGRAAELQRVLDLIDGDRDGRPGPAIAAITGMAGIGKTALAVHAAHLLRRQGRFPDVQLAVNLRGFDPELPPADPAQVLDALLRRLGFPGDRLHAMDLAGRAAAYRRALAGKRAVIVLDNAATADQVRPLLPDRPGCLTLVTSRRALRGLPGVRHLPLDVFSTGEALHLLRATVGAERIDADPDTAARIAGTVGCLPLAVGLVASRIKDNPEWTLADHLERLTARRERLRLDDGVDLALGLSYDDLAGEHRRLFRLLAMHPGRDLDGYAAAALADLDLAATGRQLDALLAGHLLHQETPGRYEFHDLVRVYAMNQANDQDPASARNAALTRLFDHYRYAAALAMDQYAPHERGRRPPVADPGTPTPAFADRDAAVRWLDHERPNLIAAAVHATQLGWLDHTSRLSTTLFRYLDAGAHHQDAEILHSHATHSADPVERARAVTCLAAVYWRVGRYREALSYFQQALTTYRRLGDRAGQGRAQGNLGLVYQQLGRYPEALNRHQQYLAIARETGDRVSEGIALGNLGVVYQKLGRYAAALAHHEEGLVIARETGNRAGEGDALANLGTAYRLLGRHADALDHLDRALALFRDLGNREGEVGTLNDIAEAQLGAGSVELALDRHRAALAIAADLGDRYEQARAHDGIGRVHDDMGDRDAAVEHWRQALGLHTDLGTPEATELAARLA